VKIGESFLKIVKLRENMQEFCKKIGKSFVKIGESPENW
jgi:hypothetical protein